MSKKEQRLVVSTDEFKGSITWNFNGFEPLVFSVGDVWEDLNRMHPVAARAMMHGFKQKINDAGALARDTATGRADNALRVEKMRAMAERLAHGEWEMQRTGGGGVGNLVRALAEFLDKPVGEIKDKVSAMSKKEKTALQLHPEVAKILARMDAEAGSGIDAGELLAGLGE